MNKKKSTIIKILIVEDNLNDVALLQRAIKKSGLAFVSEIVETAIAFKSALESFKPDIILSDYALPSFNGFAAFSIKQEHFADIPFIIVSGTIGEENAVELIKSGINDYVLKEKLISLPQKITRALKDAAGRIEKRITDEKLVKSNHLYSFISQVNQNIVHVPHELALFHNACSIALEFGKFEIAWIGMFDSDAEKISLVAQSGIAEDDIKLFIHAPYQANDPQDYVLRSGTYYIGRDVKGNAAVEDWKPFAARYNINSCIVLPIKRSGKIIGTFNLYAKELDFSESEEIKLLVEAAKDISFALDRFEGERKQKATEELLYNNEKKFHHTLNNMIEGAQMHDFDWRYLYVNDALVSYSTYTRQELMGRTLMEMYPGIEQTELFKTLQRCMTSRVGEKFETEFIFPNGKKAYFELSIEPIPEGIFILSVDHTEKKKAKEKLMKANRLYAFLSAINQSIVHTTDKDELLNKACNIAVGVGQFLMGWIDMIDEYTGKLNTVSHQGELASIPEAKKNAGMDYKSVLLRDTPSGRVLSTGKYAVSNDVENDPALKLWLNEFEDKGIRSTISLPLTKFGKVVGVFGFHSSVVNFFDAEEIALLDEAAGDISYALEIIETTKIHRATEELADLQLKKSEAFNRGVLNSLTSHIAVIDGSGIIVAVNEAWNQFALENGETVLTRTGVGSNYFTVCQTSAAAGERIAADALEGIINVQKGVKGIFYLEYPCHSETEQRWFGMHTRKFESDQSMVVVSHQNITERILAAEAIIESEARLTEAQAVAKVGSWETDLATMNVIWSKETYRIFGIDAGKFFLKHSDFLGVVHPEEKLKVDGAFTRSLTKYGINTIEHRIITPAGIKNVEERWQIIKNNKGKPIRAIGTIQDITARKHIQENLLKSEARLKEAQAIAHMGNWEIDLLSHSHIWSDEMYKIFGIRKTEQASEKLFTSFIYPQDIAYVKATMENAFVTCNDSSFNFRFINNIGEIRFGYSEYRFDFDENKKPLRLLGIVQDVTEKKEAELKLIQSAEHNRALIENITDAIILINKSAEVIYQSSSVERITGFIIEELRGKSSFEFIHPADLNNCLDLFQQAYALPGVPIQNQYRLLTKSGNYIWIEGTITNLLHDENVKAFIVNYRDVTTRKKAEEDLVQTKMLLAEAQRLAKIGNWNFDVAKNELYWSDSMRSIYGVSYDYVPGTPKESLSLLYNEDRKRVWRELMETQKSGIELNNTYRLIRADTGEIRTLRGIANAELNEEGNLVRMYGIVEDITEIKIAQQERDNTLLELEQRVVERTKELTDKNKSITDSINYAKRIQVGLLTRPSMLTEIFPKSFILSQPRDIVSGDFFWCYQRQNKKIIIVADCTGHGVPGALMSIIGNNLINQIIIEEHNENPSEILELLDSRLKTAMRGDEQEVKDGMDIALCMVDTYFNELYFAGGFRPLFITGENGTINELPADRQTIGGGINEEKKKFETRRLPITPGQRIYLSSDGYYSQFGGPAEKKFMKSRFRKTLQTIQPYPMNEQEYLLKTALAEWAGSNEQVDDVIVVGIEL